jgi:hypothetical protein
MSWVQLTLQLLPEEEPPSLPPPPPSPPPLPPLPPLDPPELPELFDPPELPELPVDEPDVAVAVGAVRSTRPSGGPKFVAVLPPHAVGAAPAVTITPRSQA